MNCKPWTESDTNILREHYSKSPVDIKGLSTILNRPYSSISMKAFAMGITKKQEKKRGSYNLWKMTDYEEQFIRRNIESLSFNKIAKALGKHARTISIVCKRMGLTQPQRDYSQTDYNIIRRRNRGNSKPRIKKETGPMVPRSIEQESGMNRIRESLMRLGL